MKICNDSQEIRLRDRGYVLNRSCRTLLVEKTDRLYRNFHDHVTIEDLDIEVHLVKESQIISKDAKSQTKFMHGITLRVRR